MTADWTLPAWLVVLVVAAVLLVVLAGGVAWVRWRIRIDH